MREGGHAVCKRKGAEQFFVKGAHLALVEYVDAFAVRSGESVPKFGIFKVAPYKYARASVGQVVTSEAIAFAKACAGRNSVAYPEELAVFKGYHAVVTLVVYESAHGGKYDRTRYCRKPQQRGDGILFAFKFSAHI